MQQLRRGEIKLLITLSIMKLFVLSFIILFIGCFSGCKTGGSWIKSSSPNIKVISPNSLVKNPNGTFRLKKGNTLPEKEKVTSEEIPPPKKVKKPQVINEPQKTKNKIVSEKAELQAAKSKPIAPANSSAEPQLLPPAEVKAAGSHSSFEPTVTDIRMNVVPKSTEPKGKVDKPIDAVIIEEQMKIDWTGLFMFYFIAIMLLIMSWMIYDLVKDFLNNKKRNKEVNPFQKEDTAKNTLNRKKRGRRGRKK